MAFLTTLNNRQSNAGAARTSDLNISTRRSRLVFNQRDSVGHVFAGGFHVVDPDFLVRGQSGRFERLSIRIGVNDALAQFELGRLARRQRIQDQNAAWRVLFNSTGGFGPGLGIGTAAGRLRVSKHGNQESNGANQNCLRCEPHRRWTGDVLVHNLFGSVSHAEPHLDVEIRVTG
jgi:hypothetical protein